MSSLVRPRAHLAILLVALLLGGLGFAARSRAASAAADGAGVMPVSAVVEETLGVRFTRLAVVGDGGLLVLSYTVLDAEKATEFTSTATRLPVLTNEATGRSTRHVSLMRVGHSLTAGQTYYWVYNGFGTFRRGDSARISALGLTLAKVPVR